MIIQKKKPSVSYYEYANRKKIAVRSHSHCAVAIESCTYLYTKYRSHCISHFMHFDGRGPYAPLHICNATSLNYTSVHSLSLFLFPLPFLGSFFFFATFLAQRFSFAPFLQKMQ